MLSKNRLFFFSLIVLLVALLVIAFAPLAISNGVRLWVWWGARQEGLTATIDQIDAPFLRPIFIRQVHLRTTREEALRLDIAATDVTIGLNLKHLLLHMRGRMVRNLSVRELRVQLRHGNPNLRAISTRGWVNLQRLLPENLSISSADVRLENGPTLILWRGGMLSASESEPGRFGAGEIMIASPWFRQTFSQLRGATHFESNRLTLGGLTLSRGLDLQSVTADLSRLGKQRVGLQFDVDAFGGKIRGNIAHEWRSAHSNWKIAGAASDISLAQTSDAFGFTDRVDGLLHAANFTFRGNFAEPDRITASLWSELTRLTWRNRTAEAIMLGAAVYSRKIQLQQLYIRQRSNQFTLSGEAAFPANASGWLSPDFRGDISASINQLGEFLALAGANPKDFAGKIMIEGAMDTRDRKFGGQLAVEGASLTFFKTAVDKLNAKLNLKGTELEIERLEITRKNDSLAGQGKIGLSGDHDYSGTLHARADNLLDYLSSFRGSPGKNVNAIPLDVHATITSSTWDATGSIDLPGSSPINFTANFLLRIGMDWNAFQLAPVHITLDFPSILLAKAPQPFQPQMLRDGILSGTISLSDTLQHPWILGEVQLVNGKFSADAWTPFNVTDASGCIAFQGGRAAVEFLNLATKDVDLSLRGEIDFQNPKDVAVRMTGATPMFDLTSQPIDCVNKIQIAPAVLTLAPAVAELEFRGGLFEPGWTVNLHEATDFQSLALSDPDDARKFSLCLSTGPEEKTLLIGGLTRSGTAAETARPKREAGRQ